MNRISISVGVAYASMAKVPEYKKFAAECLRWATEAELEEDQEALLEMAQDFSVAAIQLEAGRLPEKDSDDSLSKADFDASAT